MMDLDVDFGDGPLEVDFGDAPAPRKFGLRDYQFGWIKSFGEDRETYSRMLGVGATGTGKTTFFAAASKIEHERGGRTLVLENRDKLVRQTAERIRKETGLGVDVEMAADTASPFADVVVASVQTLCRDARLLGFADNHFTLVIPDESHHALSKSYQKVLNYFYYGASSLEEKWESPLDGSFTPKCCVLGVTATPELGTKQSLAEFYQKQCFNYPYISAVNDGWLVPPVMENIPLKINLKGLRTGRTPNGSDLMATDLSERLIPILEALADQIVARASNRKGIVFLPSIECARLLALAITRKGLRGIFVSGECLDVDEKTEAFVAASKGTFLCNACLDLKTEVLTDKGWVGCDEMTMEHNVANWSPDGTVLFAPPKRIIRRPLAAGEHMVSIDSRTINLRVTNTHDMIVRCKEGGRGTKKIRAEFLRAGHNLPTFGVAKPATATIQDRVKKSTTGRRIAANSHTLRTRYGFGYEQSIAEAARREAVRAKLKFTQPNELTEDDCRFIGFWVADGGAYNLRTGGIEYRLTQSTVYPNIIAWVDSLLGRMGVHSLKKFVPDNNGFTAWQWHLCRGTGGGTQERPGLYRLEPYLKKNGTPLLWALDERQFDALIEGYWYGDGHHRKAEFGMGRTAVFNDTKKPWIELLCSIGPVRGWRCAMKRIAPYKTHHSEQWRLCMIKGIDSCLSSKTPIIHEPFSPENVWCVEVDSGNIITRRRGKVIATGNCLYVEGADFPDVDCVVPARATKSVGFYKQQIGRGTRVLPGVVDHLPTAELRRTAIANSAKPNVLILDPLWISDRIDLCDCYDLFTDRPEIKEKMKLDGTAPSQATAEAAERDFIKALEIEAKKHSKKAARVIDPLAWAVSVGDEALVNWEPQNAWDSQPATQGQLDFLLKHHIDVSKIKYKGQAQKYVGRVLTRIKLNLATVHQLSLMKQLGLDEKTCSTLTIKEAGLAIDAAIAHKKEKRLTEQLLNVL